MAIGGSRSPSPTQNSRINSNIRNSELNSPLRKSFNGNPFPRPLNSSRSFVPPTPANSPADFVSRNLSTKDEKENDKDHHTIKHPKTRSPSVPKSTNHFMIPTISAASKINPSPRKKVLADRNEPIRNNDTQDFDKKQVVLINAVSDVSLFNPDSLPKVSNIAPLDADPNRPPYDPKTNYLSPRPQFLHYRPNPRLELYYQDQGSETKNLENSFLRESFSSESEVSEGSETESSNKESEDSSSVHGKSEIAEIETEVIEVTKLGLIAKDTEIDEIYEARDVSPVETITDNYQNEPIATLSSVEVYKDNELEDTSLVNVVSKEDEPNVSEPEPISDPISTHVPKETSEVKSFKRRKFPLLLFLLIACFAVSYIDFPISGAPVYENLTSSKLYEKLSSAKFYEESLNDVTRNMKMWAVESTSYVNVLISSFSGAEKIDVMTFSNLTYNHEDPFIHTKRVEEVFDHDHDEDENLFEHEDEFERLLDETLENDDQNIGRERDFDVVSDLPKSFGFEESSRLEAVEFVPKEAKMVKEEDVVTSEIAEISEIEVFTTVPSFGNTFEYTAEEVESMIVEGGNNFDNHLVSDSEVESSFTNSVGKDCERSEIGGIKHDEPIVSVSETEPAKVEPEFENTLRNDDSTLGLTPNNEASKRTYKTLAMFILVIALLAAPFLMYLKKKKKKPNAQKSATDPISTKKKTKSTNIEQSYSPESEMSSFDGSVSYSKGYTWGITNEAQSQERKHKRVLKRESLASSSGFSVSDSPSYGSFTTYEKIQSKLGHGEDEITPVRRSSRIKKIQVTSP